MLRDVGVGLAPTLLTIPLPFFIGQAGVGSGAGASPAPTVISPDG